MCDVCGKVMQKSALRRHKNQKHAVIKTFYACDHPCKRVFERSDKLKEHQAKCKWRGKPENVCSKCHEHVQLSLKTHLTKNLCPKKFNCDQCGGFFRTETDYGKHQCVIELVFE